MSHCTTAAATSFLTFDARSIAMGGTGVVTARSHNASLFNPALLVNRDPHRSTRLHLHSYVGARLADRDNFIGAATEFKDRYEDVSVDSHFGDLLDIPPAEATGNDLRALSHRVRELQTDINHLSNKPLRASASLGAAFSYPVGQWSWGAYHRQYLVLGSRVHIAQQDTDAINRTTAMTDSFAELVDQAAKLEDVEPETLTLESAIQAAKGLLPSIRALEQYIDYDRLRQDIEDDALNKQDPQTYLRQSLPDTVYSTIDTQGAAVTDQGISVARNFSAPGELTGAIQLGATLKQLDYTTISFRQAINAFELDAYEDQRHRKRHSRTNIDLGLNYNPAGPLHLGMVIRNLVAYDLATVHGEEVPIRPIARLGLGYVTRALRLSLDVDLTRNEPLGFDPDKQYVSFGAEWFVWRNTALRAGLRSNLVDGETLPSLGIGLGGRHYHLDLGLAHSFNGDEYAAGLQAGLAF